MGVMPCRRGPATRSLARHGSEGHCHFVTWQRSQTTYAVTFYCRYRV